MCYDRFIIHGDRHRSPIEIELYGIRVGNLTLLRIPLVEVCIIMVIKMLE